MSMPELRSLVAGVIQSDPTTYSKVVLEQNPDDYCRWIQTSDAWGGFIEMSILSKHFEIEICSLDVQVRVLGAKIQRLTLPVSSGRQI